MSFGSSLYINANIIGYSQNEGNKCFDNPVMVWQAPAYSIHSLWFLIVNLSFRNLETGARRHPYWKEKGSAMKKFPAVSPSMRQLKMRRTLANSHYRRPKSRSQIITNFTGTFKVPSPGDSKWSDSGSEEEEGNTEGMESMTPSIT